MINLRVPRRVTRATLEGLRATGSWLGVGIGNLINVFNPDRVVVGGIYHELYPYLEQSLRGGVRDVALRSAGESARIVGVGWEWTPH